MLLSMLAPPGAPDPQDLIRLYLEKNLMNYCIVQNDVVINVIVWDGTTPYAAVEGCELHAWDGPVNIGWAWVDGAPVDPNPPPPPTSQPPEATPVVVLP